MTITARKTEHLNHRPDWDCRICKRPWPCASARAGLLVEFRAFPSVLTIYLSGQMYDAMHDLTAQGQPAPADMYDRFLSWTRVPDHRTGKPFNRAPGAATPRRG